jgi:glycosyltransferase involved in cell wall biosynthesis
MDYGLSRESIICFAGEDWWYHHPHSKNHILKRLARQNNVLFVNSITMGLPSLSNPDFFLKVRRKLKSYLKWLRKVPEGLWVMTPINLPFYGSKLARKVNWFLLVLQLRLAMLLVGIHKPVLWVAIPSAADLVGHLGERMLLYQVSDKYDANEDSALSADVIRSFDRKLKQSADVVMFSGRRLFEESREPNRFYLEQAVDFEHFATEAREMSPEVADIPRPILGYFGAMDYVMDTDLMSEVSRLRPDWHWVMLGLKSNLVQVSAPNIHFLGPKPYAALPKFVKCFDVCVLPWKQDNAFTSYGSAIKVREYLATGKPVVISPLYEYLNTPGVRIYRSTEELVALVEDALRNDSAEAKRQRQAVVRGNDWDARTRQVAGLIQLLKKGEKYAYAAPAEVAQTVAPSGSLGKQPNHKGELCEPFLRT